MIMCVCTRCIEKSQMSSFFVSLKFLFSRANLSFYNQLNFILLTLVLWLFCVSFKIRRFGCIRLIGSLQEAILFLYYMRMLHWAIAMPTVPCQLCHAYAWPHHNISDSAVDITCFLWSLIDGGARCMLSGAIAHGYLAIYFLLPNILMLSMFHKHMHYFNNWATTRQQNLDYLTLR